MIIRAIAGVVALVSLLGVLRADDVRAAEDVCERFGVGSVAGQVKNGALTEISGLVASRIHAGVYWTHNDSGGKPEFFALGLDGADLGRYAVTGATAIDWEDIAIGPKAGATGSYLYAGDIGDNAAEAPAGAAGQARESITVYRVAEPSVTPTAPGVALTGTERFTLKYPAGANDAEAMFVDPLSGDLVIVTKSPVGMSHVMVVRAAELVDGATITMTDAGVIQIIPPVKVSTFPGTWVTGADISPDGSLILLRTYQAVLAFSRGTGQSVAGALQEESCTAPSTDEGQGEAVAIASDMSRYVTISEGLHQPINVFSIASAVAPTTASSTTTTAAVLGERLARTGGDDTVPMLVSFVALIGLALRRSRGMAKTRRPANSCGFWSPVIQNPQKVGKPK